MGKNLPAVQETWIQSPGQKEPLEKTMATRSSILAWETLWTEEPGRLHSMGLPRVKNNLATTQHKLTSWQDSILAETQDYPCGISKPTTLKSEWRQNPLKGGHAPNKRWQWPWWPDLATCRTCESWPQTVTLSQVTGCSLGTENKPLALESTHFQFYNDQNFRGHCSKDHVRGPHTDCCPWWKLCRKDLL